MIDNVLHELYGDVADILMGRGAEPQFVPYIPYNANEGAALLYNAIIRNSTIAVHADIDTDGFGSGYVFKTFVERLNPNVNVVVFTNKKKVHGVFQDFTEYVNMNIDKIGLVVILDSSTNNIEYIKQMQCNVLVVDHHEVLINSEELKGNTAFGKYAVVTNMIGTEDDTKLCGCAVLYYLLRYMLELYDIDMEIEQLLLEQWVGVTLISDVIPLANMRNQWFMEKLFNSRERETTLRRMMKSLGVERVDKNLIAYKISPLINSAIRGGGAAYALAILLREPERIAELAQYKDYQDKMVQLAVKNSQPSVAENVVTVNVTNCGIPKELTRNYCGLVAAKISKEYQKVAYIYVVENGVCSGSVRGTSGDVDYREKCEKAGLKAEGHRAAFGLEIKEEFISNLDMIMSSENLSKDMFVSVGLENGGLEHYGSLGAFKIGGNVMLMALANSRLSSNESLEIHAYLENLNEIQRGKANKYEVDGLELVSFSELNSGRVRIYPEVSNFGISLYTSNL